MYNTIRLYYIFIIFNLIQEIFFINKMRNFNEKGLKILQYGRSYSTHNIQYTNFFYNEIFPIINYFKVINQYHLSNHKNTVQRVPQCKTH